MLRMFAHFISILFHPILMASYMLFLLMWINPYLFGASEWSERAELLILILPTSVLIPVICILLMKPLGFIKSYEMKTREERIIPYVTVAVLYCWLFINILKQPVFPQAYAVFFLGGLAALFLTFFINNFSKISAHAVGAGGLIGMILLTRYFYSYEQVSIGAKGTEETTFSINAVVIGIIIIAGLIGTARLILKAHDRQDIYGGYVVGFSTQLIAYQILTNYGT